MLRILSSTTNPTAHRDQSFAKGLLQAAQVTKDTHRQGDYIDFVPVWPSASSHPARLRRLWTRASYQLPEMEIASQIALKAQTMAIGIIS